MIKRTTIEIDQELLERAKRALGESTARGAVEQALRRVANEAESETSARVAKQRRYLTTIASRVDVKVLGSEEMWR